MPLYRFLRRYVSPTAVAIPLGRRRMIRAATRLDHALPADLAGPSRHRIVVPQPPPGKGDEDVVQAGLPRVQSGQ
jgi:hypothetical protein